MKRVVIATGTESANTISPSEAVNSVPDISNRFIDPDTLFAWLDKLIKVRDDAQNICNN